MRGSGDGLWTAVAPWPAIFLCGHRDRFEVGATLANYTETEALLIPGGRKGGSMLRVWKRNP